MDMKEPPRHSGEHAGHFGVRHWRMRANGRQNRDGGVKIAQSFPKPARQKARPGMQPRDVGWNDEYPAKRTTALKLREQAIDELFGTLFGDNSVWGTFVEEFHGESQAELNGCRCIIDAWSY